MYHPADVGPPPPPPLLNSGQQLGPGAMQHRPHHMNLQQPQQIPLSHNHQPPYPHPHHQPHPQAHSQTPMTPHHPTHPQGAPPPHMMQPTMHQQQPAHPIPQQQMSNQHRPQSTHQNNPIHMQQHIPPPGFQHQGHPQPPPHSLHPQPPQQQPGPSMPSNPQMMHPGMTNHHPSIQHAGPGPNHSVPPHHNPMYSSAHLRNKSPYYQSIPQSELKISEFNRRLQQRPSRHPIVSPLPNQTQSHINECVWWERFVTDFFDSDATLTLVTTLEDKPIKYTIGRTLIPRFFRSYFDGGVIDLSISVFNAREICHPNSPIVALECDHARITTHNIIKMPTNFQPHIDYRIIVQTEGQLFLEFVTTNCDELKIKSWRFNTVSSRESIDRTITGMGFPNTYLGEPFTRQGLTKSTVVYLKMCLILEPMQEIMLQHQRQASDPRTCLKNYLFEKFNYKSSEEVVVQPKRQRKKKAATANSNPTGSKKSKLNSTQNISANNNATNINNPIANAPISNMNGNMNNGINYNSMNHNVISPTVTQQDFSVPPQDVMIVGEPSLMGGEYGDDNERMITRMENQFDHNQPNNNQMNNLSQPNHMNHMNHSHDLNHVSGINNNSKTSEVKTVPVSGLQAS